jgi:Uma2 family endonuclease
MLAVEKKKKYTFEDYMQLQEGAPFQLINNELIMLPLLIHQLILGEFYDALKAFVKSQTDKGLIVLPPMDIHFDDGNVYQPDLVYISRDRIAEIAKSLIEGAPDLVVEILSPSNACYDLRQKKDIYEKFVVKEYIIIDPIA